MEAQLIYRRPQNIKALLHELDLHNAVFKFKEDMFDYEPEASDVFLLSYPKCGSNWLQYMFWSLLNDGKEMPEGSNVNEMCPWIEYVGAEGTAKVPSPRLIKCHLAFKFVPKHLDAKYICLIRNPKDVVVSFYHHFLGLGHETDDTWFSFVDRFIEGKVRWGSYWEHTKEMLRHIDDENVMVVKYEDLKKDTPGMLRKIADFSGKFSEPLSDSLIATMRENTSVKSMQKDHRRFYPKELPWVRKDFGFVRQGAMKGWQSHLNKEQSDRIDAKFAESFKGTPAEHWFTEQMRWTPEN